MWMNGGRILLLVKPRQIQILSKSEDEVVNVNQLPHSSASSPQ